MSGYSAKNYTEQGGDVTHIGGKLVIEEGAEVEGLSGGGGGGSSYTLPVATSSALGGVKAQQRSDEAQPVSVDEEGNLYVPSIPRIAHQEDANDAEDIVDKYNALLKAMETAGIMLSE